MRFEIAFSILVAATGFIQINPYGALIYAVVMSLYQPKDMDEFTFLTFGFLVVVMMTTLVVRGRGWKG